MSVNSGSDPRRQISTLLKNISTLAVSVPINLSIKLDFVYVNGPRQTYFVDALCTY